MCLDLRSPVTANTQTSGDKTTRAAFAARVSLSGKETQPMLSNSATISFSGAAVQSETTTIRMLETTKAGSSS